MLSIHKWEEENNRCRTEENHLKRELRGFQENDRVASKSNRTTPEAKAVQDWNKFIKESENQEKGKKKSWKEEENGGEAWWRWRWMSSDEEDAKGLTVGQSYRPVKRVCSECITIRHQERILRSFSSVSLFSCDLNSSRKFFFPSLREFVSLILSLSVFSSETKPQLSWIELNWIRWITVGSIQYKPAQFNSKSLMPLSTYIISRALLQYFAFALFLFLGPQLNNFKSFYKFF